MNKNKNKIIRLSNLPKVERALILLAREVQRLPYCEIKVEDVIIYALGLEKKPVKKK